MNRANYQERMTSTHRANRHESLRAAQCWVLALALLLAGCGSQQDAGKQLHALFDREWQHRLKEDPLLATSVGEHRYNDLLPDFRPGPARDAYDFYRGVAAELQAIPYGALNEEDQVSYDVFRVEVQRQLDAFETGSYLMPLNADSGFHAYFPRLGQQVPLDTESDYENYLSRLRAWPEAVDGLIELLREGMQRGMTPPAVTMTGYEETAAAHVVGRAEGSEFFQPFVKLPPGIPATRQEELREAGRQAVMAAIVPGYRKLHAFLKQEYLPGCRATLAAADLPKGSDFYQRELRYYTTLPLTAEQIHDTGLQEVARIRDQMEAVIRGTGFQGSFSDFVRFLRTDARFYAETEEELLQRAAWICKRMDGVLPSLFGKLPRQPYTVEPVPAAIAPKYTPGRYVPAPRDGRRPGIYWVNTYALHTRPLYGLEALTLHEAVPGHHLQIALASEMQGLPPFRNTVYFPAFGEGWALYAEWLGTQTGFYADPYADFGRLSYEMWRACRLVVDTGVHTKGWSRQQVIDYLAANTALSEHECTTETDRYISWPGQAVAYKIGELKVKELRQRAERELGPKFRIRAFHDELLKNGSIPLETLERVVDRFVERER